MSEVGISAFETRFEGFWELSLSLNNFAKLKSKWMVFALGLCMFWLYKSKAVDD